MEEIGVLIEERDEGRGQEATNRAVEDKRSDPIRFMGAGCRFLNFYPCRVTIYGKTFSSTEMAYQWKKAKFMGDEEAATQIQKTGEARRAKTIANLAFGARQRRTWGGTKVSQDGSVGRPEGGSSNRDRQGQGERL